VGIYADLPGVHLHNDRKHYQRARGDQDRVDLYLCDCSQFAILTRLALDGVARGPHRARRHGARVCPQSSEGNCAHHYEPRCDRGDALEYEAKEKEKRLDNHIPAGEPILFFEVTPGDASEFSGVLKVRGESVDGFKILRTESPAVPNAIAAFLLFLRNETGKLPHVYFGWSEGNPVSYLLKYIAFGEGDTAPVTHEVLRQAEKDPDQRPIVHVGG
jgi:hypothetical protein